MTEQHQQIAELITKYLTGIIAIPEQEELDEWLARSEKHRRLFRTYMDREALMRELEEREKVDEEAAWNRLALGIPILQSVRNSAPPSIPPSPEQQDLTGPGNGYGPVKKPGRPHRSYKWIAVRSYAAIFLFLLISTGMVYFFYRFREGGKANTSSSGASTSAGATALSSPDSVGHAKKKDFLVPATNREMLTLADNTTLRPEDFSVGLIRQQGRTSIYKTDSGVISYVDPGGAHRDTLYNRVSTPRGGWCELLLPDRTRVRLNASSSLRFPVSFVGKERIVELEGEAWFEIFRNKTRPFLIKVRNKNMQIKAVGTHFNVMAYTDDSVMKTSLQEGSISLQRLASGAGRSHSVPLRPGQQYLRYNSGRDSILTDRSLVDAALAWKKGEFRFKNEPMGSILRQVARWYDDAVIVCPDTLAGGFTLAGSRNKAPKEFFDRWSDSYPAIRFTIKENEITVSTTR